MAVCERLIGTPEEIARICGIAEKSPYAWRFASKGRHAGDLTSAVHMRALLAHSEAHGLGLTAEHLIRGATEAEVEAILAGIGADPVPHFAPRRRQPRLEAAE